MRIAFVTENDAHDVRAWSGAPFHMREAFERHFAHVDCITVPHPGTLALKTDEKLRRVGEAASRGLAGLNVEAVICQGASMLPHLSCEVPVAVWHDATWSFLHSGHYDTAHDFESFQRELPDLFDWDRRALARADLVVFCADAPARAAAEHYGLPSEKTRVLPFGSNVPGLTDSELGEALDHRRNPPLQLLFLGVEWRRKGLPRCIDLILALEDAGIEARLTTAGCDPDYPLGRAAGRVRHLGFLDKSIADEAGRLHELLRTSHFLVHPASFECFGNVLVEANANGVPVLAAPVGGIPTVVEPGVNGELFDLHSWTQQATHYLVDLHARGFEAYEEFARSARRAQRERLDWDVSARRLRKWLQELVDGRVAR